MQIRINKKITVSPYNHTIIVAEILVNRDIKYSNL